METSPSSKINLLELLEHIDPTALDYKEWVSVGMALKVEGYTVSDWDACSRGDSKRYHSGDCDRKWESFNGSDSPVTGGTIVQLAKNQGWRPMSGGTDCSLDWSVGEHALSLGQSSGAVSTSHKRNPKAGAQDASGRTF